MATENILIKFTSDTSGLKDSVTELQKIGKLTDEDAKKFAQMEGFAEGVADALREAGVDAKTFNKALADSEKTTKSLASEINKARNEAVAMSRAYGASSEQAKAAAKNVANLKDEQDKLNKAIFASDPSKRFEVYGKAVQGVQGAFQAATGALQLFGVENEKLVKLGQQFQGVLNITQGINSIVQLKDVYSQLRLVLGVTTAAQTGLNAAMLANPLGAITVVVLALASAFGVYKIATDESTESLKKASQAEKDLYDDTLRRLNIFNKGADNYKKNTAELDIQLRLAQGKITKYAADLERLALEEAASIAEIQSKPFGEKSQLDVIAVRQIQRIYALRRKVLEAEQAKEGKIISHGILESIESTELRDGLIEASQELAKAIQKELDKIEPIPTKELNSGTREYLDNLNLQIEQLNKQILFTTLDVFDNLLDSQSQSRIAQLEEEKKKGLITEEAYQKELGKIRRKQALQDRAFAIFEVTINTAQAISKVLAQGGLAAPPLVAAFSALGAAQIAAILSAPLPKFKQGTLNVGGGNLDADGGMHAIIHEGEAIIPKDRNRDYHPTIKALYNRQIKPSEINAFVASRLGGKMNHNVNAKINSKELARVLSGSSDAVTIRNTSVIAKQIGREISNNINRRRS